MTRPFLLALLSTTFAVAAAATAAPAQAGDGTFLGSIVESLDLTSIVDNKPLPPQARSAAARRRGDGATRRMARARRNPQGYGDPNAGWGRNPQPGAYGAAPQQAQNWPANAYSAQGPVYLAPPNGGPQPVYAQPAPQQSYAPANYAQTGYTQAAPVYSRDGAPALQPAAAYQPVAAQTGPAAVAQPAQYYDPRNNPLVPSPGQTGEAPGYAGAFGANAPGQNGAAYAPPASPALAYSLRPGRS